MLPTSLGRLAAQYGCELIGDPSVSITSVATLRSASAGDLSFYANSVYRKDLLHTKATAVIIRSEDEQDCSSNALISRDPYLTYALIASEMYPSPVITAGAHPSAVIAESADIGIDVQISANATICEQAVVHTGVFVGPGVVVGPACTVGSGSRLLANSVLVENVTLGERNIIHSGAIIGADGFGNAKSESGWVKVPQLAGVSIGNDVEIGANSTVDKGSIDDTVIGDGVRIDNLVQIGHNVKVGSHTAIASSAAIAGSAIIGERCMLAGQVGVVGHVRICDDVIVSGATVVSKDIKVPGLYSGSFPGEKDKDWKRKVARFRRIEKFEERVRKLENKMTSDD